MWFNAKSAGADVYPNAIAVMLPAQQGYLALYAALNEHWQQWATVTLDLQNEFWRQWLRTWQPFAPLSGTSPSGLESASTIAQAAATPLTDTVIESGQMTSEGIAAAAETTQDSAEDLTAIAGIGPTIAKKLIASGIRSYRQIADWTDQDIDTIEATIMEGRLSGRIRRDDWVGQARTLSDR